MKDKKKGLLQIIAVLAVIGLCTFRSEERRVGKECM